MRKFYLAAMFTVLLSVLLLTVAGAVLADPAISINLWSWGWEWRCVGWRMRYNIDVTNQGDETLHNVYVSNPLPEGTYPDDTITTQGYYYGYDGNGAYALIWDLGDMDPSDTDQKWLELNTQGRREPGYLIHTAYVFCDELPPASSTHSQLYVDWPVECGGPGIPPEETPPASTPTPRPTLPAGIEQVVLQQGANFYSGTQDTYLSSYPGEADVNYTGEGRLALRSNDEMTVLVKFDLSSAVPADAVVLEASLDMEAVDWGGGHATIVSAYRVTRPWVVAETTWISATGTTLWAGAGCNGEGDRDVDPVGTFQLENVGDSPTLDVTTLVIGWLADPASNHGIILKGELGTKVRHNLAAAEYPSVQSRPKLTIYFVRATPTPTATATNTPTYTPTATPTYTPTWTPTATCSPTPIETLFRLNLPFIFKGE